MGAPGAGAPMKFLSGTHKKSHFALKCFLCYQFSVHIGIRAPVHQIIVLRLCVIIRISLMSYLQTIRVWWFFAIIGPCTGSYIDCIAEISNNTITHSRSYNKWALMITCQVYVTVISSTSGHVSSGSIGTLSTVVYHNVVVKWRTMWWNMTPVESDICMVNFYKLNISWWRKSSCVLLMHKLLSSFCLYVHTCYDIQYGWINLCRKCTVIISADYSCAIEFITNLDGNLRFIGTLFSSNSMYSYSSIVTR